MPKISPRPEITGHPLYQATMAAQHAAYQLMREVPADRKADAARLHAVCVHATTWATAALDPGEDRPAAFRELAKSAAEAKQRLAPLADLAADAAYPDTVAAKLDEIAAAAEAGLQGHGAAA
jgi:hypothetical protein